MPHCPTTQPSQLTANSQVWPPPRFGPSRPGQLGKAGPHCSAQRRDTTPRQGTGGIPGSAAAGGPHPRLGGLSFLGFWPSSPRPWGGAAAARSRRGSGGSSPGVAEQEAGRAAGGGAARCGASARGAGGGVCAGLGGQPRRTAAAGARGAGRKSLFTQTAHRLGNNAVKEVSRLGLTAPTSCSHTHTHTRGKKKKKKEEREKEKKGGKIRISLQEQQTVCRRLSAWKVGGFRPVPPRNSPEEGS